MDKHPIKLTVVALLIILTAGTVFTVSRGQSVQKGMDSNQTASSYAPKTVIADAPQETVVHSPDGKMTLAMKEERGKEMSTFVFLIAVKATGVWKEIYRQTAPAGSITIPFNTFSPDNKYIFLKKSEEGSDKYFVLSTVGTMLTEDSLFITFSDAFESKYIDYKITDVTGWGGLTLIVINTEKAGGGEGPSFWYDVAGGGFIQLSSRFN